MMPARGRPVVAVAVLALVALTACSVGSEVHVVGADGSNHLRVGSGMLGALSRNGNQVLFSQGGDIAVATRDGGVRLLTSDGFDDSPTWSPDGGRVAFSRDTAPDDTYQQDVYVMNGDGTAQRSLTAGPEDDDAPVWSPDGTRLAFFRRADARRLSDERDLYVVNADGSALRRVGQGAQAEGAPSWSPDGRRIAFAWSGPGEGAPVASGIAVAQADGSDMARITQTARVANTYQAADGSPDWSPDGARIVFSRQGGVHVIGPDGSGLSELAPRGNDPKWAPDGKQIAFCCAGRKAYDDGIFTMGPDGSGMRRLYKQGYSPTWSGDGTLIAFEKLR